METTVDRVYLSMLNFWGVDYMVTIRDRATDNLTLTRISGEKKVWQATAPNYGTNLFDLTERPGFKIGMAKLDDFDVMYFYDAHDGGFGYGFNLGDDWLSEWGFAPFTTEDQG
jgi:hypothetical protein